MSARLPTKSQTVPTFESHDWPEQGDWTYDDWTKLPDDGWRYEVIKGVLHMTPAPTPQHQRISRRLQRALEDFLHDNNLGEVFDAPIDLLLPGQETPVQPDLVYIPPDQSEMVTKRRIEGAPPLLVEVLSPGNWWVDRHPKFELYAECGVQEYWIVDPQEETVEVYTSNDGQYALLDKWKRGEVTTSYVLAGFHLEVDAIFTERGLTRE